ncbi:MAG: hypothetical protein ACLUQC_04210 [Lactococcus raffinolactis]|uniref:hypothetical protein n=1 Tax=Pseudolactococcus raffinolactis TaxID=1366 RepID=UPI0039924D03
MKKVVKLLITICILCLFTITAYAQDYPQTIITSSHNWTLTDAKNGIYTSYIYDSLGTVTGTVTKNFQDVQKEQGYETDKSQAVTTQMTVLENLFKQVGTENNPSEKQLTDQISIVQDEINKLPTGTLKSRLQGQLDGYKKQLADTVDNAKAFSEAQKMYAKAIKADNLSDLSVYTSYMYTDEGFFGVKDAFPKMINSLVQAVFFIPKLLYFITAKAMTALRSQDVMTQVSGVVTTSKTIYDKVLNVAYPYLIFFTIFSIAETFAKTGSAVRALKKGVLYMLPFIMGSVLYAPVTMYGQNTTVLGGGITTVKSVTDEFSATIINNMSVGGKQIVVDDNQNMTENSVTALKAQMFNDVIKKPFEALNFKTNEVKDNQEILNTELLATKGKADKVKDFHKKYEKESDLEFSSIGSKFIVAISAGFKSSILLFIMLGMTLFTYAINYFVILLLAFLVIVLILVMFPQLQQIIFHFLLTIAKFTAIGSFGLVGASILLYVNSLIEQATEGLGLGYFLTTLLQVAIWYLVYRNRRSIFGFLKKGKVSLNGVAKKMTPEFNKPNFEKPSYKSDLESKTYNKKQSDTEPVSLTKKLSKQSKDGFYQAKDFVKSKGDKDKNALLKKEREVKRNLVQKAKQEADTKNEDKNQDGQPFLKKTSGQRDKQIFTPHMDNQKSEKEDKVKEDLKADKKQLTTLPEVFEKSKDKSGELKPKNRFKTKLNKEPVPSKQTNSFSDEGLKSTTRKTSSPIEELRIKRKLDRYPSGIEIPKKKGKW